MENGLGSFALSSPLNRTLSDQVADQLREAILDGRLKPGQRIVESNIADAMEMSRGPVRDALRMLETDRLVVRYPHRGTFVAWLTLHDAEEIYSLREALETLVVDFAIKFATDEQLDELDVIVDRMSAGLDQDYTQLQATDIDLEFHDAVCRISNHSRAQTAWSALRSQVRLLILTHRVQQPLDFRENAVEWHRVLAAALRQRDRDQAIQTLRAHLAVSFSSTVTAIKSSNLKPPSDISG